MGDPGAAIVAVIVYLVGLCINGFLTWGEETFLAIGEACLKDWEEQGDRHAAFIRRLAENDRRFVDRLRAARTCLAILVVGYLIIRILLFDPMWICLVASLLIFAVIWIVLGDRLPRRLALKNPEKNALKSVWVFRLFYYFFAPLDWICTGLVFPLLRLCRINPREDPDRVTEDDIREMMDEGEEDGFIEGSQKDMVNNIFAFDDIAAAIIMTPRTDMVAAEVNDSIADVVQKAVEHGYSRIPIYENDIDHIVGILYIKDLLPYVGQTIPADVSLRRFLREVSFVPDTKKCDDLFEEMNEKHRQMAVVVDEYGGVAGLVTIEDLLESIVGNMQDEFDHEEDEIRKISENEFVIDGALSIGDFSESIGIELPDGDYDTVAGFLMDQLGHIPEENEHPSVAYENAVFTVREMDDRRIEQVLVQITPKEPEE